MASVSKETKELIKKYVDMGMSDSQIAEILGKSIPSITYHRRRMGIFKEKGSHGSKQAILFDDIVDEILLTEDFPKVELNNTEEEKLCYVDARRGAGLAVLQQLHPSLSPDTILNVMKRVRIEEAKNEKTTEQEFEKQIDHMVDRKIEERKSHLKPVKIIQEGVKKNEAD